jgi:hypothetical protein
MRRLPYFLLIALAVLGAARASLAQSPDETRLSITKEVMEEIGHDQLGPVMEHFSPDLKDTLTQDQVKSAIAELVSVTGAFQKQLSQDTRKVNGGSIYVSRSQFEKFKVELGLVFDDGNRITRVWIAPVCDMSPADMETLATQMTDLLRQEHFEQLFARFSDRMKSAMPAERLEMSWSHVVMHLGAFKNAKTAKKDPEFDLVNVRCEFEQGEITVRIAYDPSGKIDGLWMLPVDEDETPKDKA